MVESYRKLQVWEKGRELVKLSYIASSAFPKSEFYGLISQIRRSAISVPSNIAEGYARSSPKEFVRFLSIAGGSLAELETQFILASDLNYISKDEVGKIINRTETLQKMLWKLRQKVNNEIKV